MTLMEFRETFNIGDLEESRPDFGSTLTVSSDDASELFYDAWGRAWAKARGGNTWAESLGYDPLELDAGGFFWWIPLDSVEAGDLLFCTEADATVGDFHQLIGEAHGSLRLAWGVGAGDLPWLMVGAFGLLSAGLTVKDVIDLAHQGKEVLDAKVYAKERRLFADWRDAGQLPMNLVQAVKAQSDWTPEELERIFGATEAEIGPLLRGLSYEATRDEWGYRHWLDRSE